MTRVQESKAVATRFYKQGNLKKALKIYNRINMYFRSKDARNNFQKEDEDALEYRNLKEELNVLNKQILTNMCVIHLKNKDWKEVIRLANDALEVDHKYTKALFLKARALTEQCEYV